MFTGFNDDVYNLRLNGSANPYRYGSYLFYQADPKKLLYKVITYVNTTS